MAVDEFGREIPATAVAGRMSRDRDHHTSHPRHHHYNSSSSHHNSHHHHSHQTYGRSSPSPASYHAPRSSRHSSDLRRQPRSSPSPPARRRRKQHPSERYVDEPMLCEYVWKSQKQRQKDDDVDEDAMKKQPDAEEQEKEEGSDKKEDNGKEKEETEIETNQHEKGEDGETYDDYRRRYCLHYVRAFFNEHMDDSWFRFRYSPLEKKRAAVQDRERAAEEARTFRNELEQSLESSKNIADSPEACSFLREARLGGGTKPASLNAAGWKRKLGDNTPETSPLKTRMSSNIVPKSHSLSLASKVLPILEVPPHVTDNQIALALMDHCMVEVEGQGVHIYSSSIYGDRLFRDCFALFANDAVRSDVIANLTRANYEARRQHRSEGTNSTNTNTNTNNNASISEREGHVPRKEQDSSNSSSKTLDLEVECSDPYGRTEIDDDGKGGTPEDGGGVPPRRSTVCVRTTPLSQPLQVLSVAVSSRDRIPRDKDAAVMIARALDVSRQIPQSCRLDGLLELLFSSSPGTPDVGDMSCNGSHNHPDGKAVSRQTEDMLDVSIAYLRRVHLFTFYNGCTFSSCVGDVLGGYHATGTIHLRLENADEILKNAREEARFPDTSRSNQDDGEGKSDEGNDAQTDADQLPGAAAASKVDLLVMRLDESISKAMEECNLWVASSGLLDQATEEQAQEIEQAEIDSQQKWSDQHSIIDEDGRARCSFHFCRKLFKDDSFLQKHLLKKHKEFQRAEAAKCHDSYMMEAWDKEEHRPVPPILVDCGAKLGLRESPVTGAEPAAVDPEPDLWRKEEENLKRMQESQQRRQEAREARRMEQEARDEEMRHSATPPPPPPPRAANFVDVDDMKEEKVEMSFDNVGVPQPPKKKKKKKKKLL